MQFKYPELLWALFLLLIPIFIHLFQLRRFKKTPFTNVKLLQKVVAESRKSNVLKKWLLLFTRLLVFTSIIIAFAQPFLASRTALQEKETVIYLDNSFSMQAKSDEGSLLGNAIQELIKIVPEGKAFDLFTNSSEYRKVLLKDIQNDLLTIIPTPEQLNLEEIQLKAQTLFSKKENTLKNLILISDFQQRMVNYPSDTSGGVQRHFVKLSNPVVNNVSLDTAFIGKDGSENFEITAILASSNDIQRIPVSMFNNDKLIAKTSAVFENQKGEAIFTLPANEVIKGKLEITDTGLGYDNHLYLNIDEKQKPKVLAISEIPTDYLRRIYTAAEFVFSSFSLKNLNYGIMDTQNLIIVNELESLPTSLIASLSSYVANGGNLVIIPSASSTKETYNQLLSKFSLGVIQEKVSVENKITHIAFSHPLYENVFEKNVENFQYPKVSEFFKINSDFAEILGYQSGNPFLLGDNGVYLFTASIDNQNSNFKQSPLIVPTFYKMGVNSLKRPQLYYTMGSKITMDVAQKIKKDHILKVSKGEQVFIPQQQTYANKVSLTFSENPFEDGIYSISENGNVLRNISFNYPRDESELIYADIDTITSTSKQNSIASLFKELQNDDRITELWKWFITLALLFILAEMLIVKFLK